MRRIVSYYFIIICFGLAAMVGCESVIQYDDSNFQPQLVINSYFAPDSVWEVYITHSKSVFDESSDLSVDNAEVIIQDLTANFEFELEHQGDGVYTTGYKPQSDHVYHIIVDDEELGISQSIGRVPAVEHIEVRSSIVENQNSQYLNIEVHSSHTNNSDTYYAWQLVNLEDTNLGNQGGGIVSDPKDQSVAVSVRDFSVDNLIFVDGKSLNCKTVQDSIPSDVINEVITKGKFSEVKNNAAIKLVAISKELYEYYHIQDQQIDKQSSNSSHQAEYYTNVINGLGIFAGYQEIYIQL